MAAIWLRIHSGPGRRVLRRGEITDALGGHILYNLVSVFLLFTGSTLNVVMGPLARHGNKRRRYDPLLQWRSTRQEQWLRIGNRVGGPKEQTELLIHVFIQASHRRYE